MKSTHMELLNLNPLLTQASSTAHILPHLQSGVPISIGQLCDDGYIATFTATNINVGKDGLTSGEIHQECGSLTDPATPPTSKSETIGSTQ